MCDGTVSVPRRVWVVFFFQAEDGIRDLVRSRGLGDVYKRQVIGRITCNCDCFKFSITIRNCFEDCSSFSTNGKACLLYTSDAADERSSVDLGGRRIIKKKNNQSSSTAR